MGRKLQLQLSAVLSVLFVLAPGLQASAQGLVSARVPRVLVAHPECISSLELMGRAACVPRLAGHLDEAARLAAEQTTSPEPVVELGLTEAIQSAAQDDADLERMATGLIDAGIPVPREIAERIAPVSGKTPRLIFNATNDVEAIWKSRRRWGITEGAVYGSRRPATSFWEQAKAMIGPREGLIVFQGEAAALFRPHSVEGPYGGLKRLLGQHKAPMGDIVLDEVWRDGNTLIVTRAHIATEAEGRFAGQSEGWSHARLWTRRLTIEPLAAAAVVGGGIAVVMALAPERLRHRPEAVPETRDQERWKNRKTN